LNLLLGKQRIFKFGELGHESISEVYGGREVPVMKENNKNYCFKDFAFLEEFVLERKNKLDRLAT